MTPACDPKQLFFNYILSLLQCKEYLLRNTLQPKRHGGGTQEAPRLTPLRKFAECMAEMTWVRSLG